MKLLTEKMKIEMPAIGTSDDSPIIKLVYHFFCPGWNWYVAEGEDYESDYIFFGWVWGLEREWGDFALSSLEEVGEEKPYLAVERDLFWTPKWTFVGSGSFYSTEEEAREAYKVRG